VLRLLSLRVVRFVQSSFKEAGVPSAIDHDLGDAGAVTPTLFLGNTLPNITHFMLTREFLVPVAVDWIKQGETVLTAHPHLALMVLLSLGVTLDEAQEKIRRANSVLDAPFSLDF
jgi:hypothetical protein